MQAFHQRSNPDPPESLSVRLNSIPGTFSSRRLAPSIPLTYCWLSEFGTEATEPDLRLFPPARKLAKSTVQTIADAKGLMNCRKNVGSE